MTPYYDHGGITIYHADCRAIPWPADIGCLVIDPPWEAAGSLLYDLRVNVAPSVLVFTDGRYMGEAVQRFGPPAWLFTWDTLNTWQSGKHRPVQQTKHCLWYGELDGYQRDAVLWGDAPPDRDHPTTKQTALAGRRLTDLWRESIRWLHNPSAGQGSAGTERFGTRQSDPALRHAKPLGWLRCLIGNCSTGLVFDPFMGSGTALRAAKDLGRPAIGIDVDAHCCELAARRLDQEALDLGVLG